MSTTIRPEISEKNEYWISRHRYYELKHFCLQYPEWVKMRQYVLEKGGSGIAMIRKDRRITDSTAVKAMMLANLGKKITMVNRAAEEADPDLAKYILIAVTEGRAYPYLYTKLEIPCGRDMYYDRYRKFFYILSGMRS